jgi:hypothetical protein
MLNPFDEIVSRLDQLSEQVKSLSLPGATAAHTEIIDTKALCERLGITEQTAVRYRKNGKIPFLSIGTSIRYDWNQVIKALENRN